MVKTYKVITARKQEEIEDKINQLAVDGWEVDNFNLSSFILHACMHASLPLGERVPR